MPSSYDVNSCPLKTAGMLSAIFYQPSYESIYNPSKQKDKEYHFSRPTPENLDIRSNLELADESALQRIRKRNWAYAASIYAAWLWL